MNINQHMNKYMRRSLLNQILLIVLSLLSFARLRLGNCYLFHYLHE